MKIIGIIPARYASTRFPGKPLAKIGEKTMIQRTIEQVKKAQSLDSFIVATDDTRIATHVEDLGYPVVMTSESCLNGTERCAEAVAILEKKGEKVDIIINIQGDEPFIRPEQIDAVGAVLREHTNFHIATLLKKIESETDLFNPNIVKAVTAATGRALYFSRQAIPHVRGKAHADWLANHTFYQHIGLYAYRAAELPVLASLAATPLENAESLEQLRWLEQGFLIGTAETTFQTIGIDTPEDLQRVLAMLPILTQ